MNNPTDDMFGVPLPSDVHAEAAVISAITIDPSQFAKIPNLRADHFYTERHRRIFEACTILRDAGEKVDAVLVASKLRELDLVAVTGGIQYLTSIADSAPFVSNVDAYSERIVEAWRRRRVILLSRQLAAAAHDAPEFATFVAERVRDIAAAAERPTVLRPIETLFPEALRRVEARRSGAERPIPVPWAELAEQLGGGLWPGLHLLIGGTGAGKSTLAFQIALAAARARTPVCYVALELGDLDVSLRVLGEHAGVSWSKLYTGRSSSNDVRRIIEASASLAGLPFCVELGRPTGWPASELERIAEEMRRAFPEVRPGASPILLVLDFLQIVGDEPEQRRSEVRERIGRAAYFARDIARRLNVAVLAISSAARDKYAALSGEALRDAGLGEDERGRRFVLSPDGLIGTGKESGDVEFAADSVTVGVRGPRLASENPGLRSVVLVTAKGRATGASWCALRFDGHRFESWPGSAREVLRAIEEGNTKRSSAAAATSTSPRPDAVATPTEPPSVPNGQRTFQV